jgi:ribosomal protein S8
LISSGVTLQEGLNMKKMIFATFFSKNQKNFYQYYRKKSLIKDLKHFDKFIKLPFKKINFLLKKNTLKINTYLKMRINNKKFWSLIKNV